MKKKLTNKAVEYMKMNDMDENLQKTRGG